MILVKYGQHIEAFGDFYYHVDAHKFDIYTKHEHCRASFYSHYLVPTCWTQKPMGIG